jgi:hypothetical protein
MKKIIKLTESDMLKLVKKVLKEQAAIKPNPVATSMTSQTKAPNPVAKRLPTDFTKTIAFFFPEGVYLGITPLKQDISKKIMDYMGIGAQVPTNNKIQLRDKGSAVKECNKKIVIFTSKPNQDEFNNWCSYENINPQYLDKAGIFEIPKDQRFYVLGNYQSVQPQTPKQ